MNPQKQFCPNLTCGARGEVGEGNIVVHSRKERRYKCKTCSKTLSETTGTALYGIKKGLDDETVRDWLKKAGRHCQAVHEHVMSQTSLDLRAWPCGGDTHWAAEADDFKAAWIPVHAEAHMQEAIRDAIKQG